MICAVITGLFAMPLGVMQFIPVYHPLHDSLGIHSEVCVLMLLAVYMLVVWSADRYPFETARVHSNIGQLFVIFHSLTTTAISITVYVHLLSATFANFVPHCFFFFSIAATLRVQSAR